MKYYFSFIFLFFALNFMGCSSNSDLKWNEEEGYRWAEISPGFFGKTGFREMSPSRTGIIFENHLEDSDIIENRILANGSGVAAGDINGNGLVDLYFTQLNGPNKLYMNLGGFRFRDITDEAGVAHEGYFSTGAVFADVNGNGLLDLLLTTADGGNALYINGGNGSFELNEESGLDSGEGSSTMALADINGSGYPDLYITRYKAKDARDVYGYAGITLENIGRFEEDGYTLIPPYDEEFVLFMNRGMPDVRQIGEMDQLYINRGDGTFRKVDNLDEVFLDENGEPQGLNPDWGLTAKFYDINGNMLPDLYVANDFWTPDRIWMNQGNGTFRSIEQKAFRKFSYSSMGVDFSDINRNGHTDIFVTEMLSPEHERKMRHFMNVSPFQAMDGGIDHRDLSIQNAMHLNRGDNTFAEIAFYSGLQATDWSWATQFMDVNLNGYEDLIVTTGHATDSQDLDIQESISQKFIRGERIDESMVLEFPELKAHNQILKNNSDLTFTNMSSEWGFDTEDIAHGFVFSDLNNSGTLDIIINRLNSPALVYQNRTNAPRIAVRLKGNSPNTQGIGAKIELEGGPVYQEKQVVSGGGYLSGSDLLVVFAADKNKNDHDLKVTWPGGNQSVLTDVKANRIYEVWESNALPPAQKDEIDEFFTQTMFTDATSLLGHIHHDDEFNDFAVQPLLPKKLSSLGPGISWIDLNQNGKDDLLITSGRGGVMGIYQNIENGKLEEWNLDKISNEAYGDQTSVIGWKQNGKTMLAVGLSNYEQENLLNPSVTIYSIFDGVIEEESRISGIQSSIGSLAAADYDGDGFVDLFVGGRFVPGRYPMNAASRLFKNVNGEFIPDVENTEKLRDPGLVTSAVFSDISQNGFPDLLVSTEWGSLRLLQNENGTFRDITADVGLDQYKGIWNGVATGDFNNNGRPDIIATNWGLNSIYQTNREHPLKMYYGDFVYDGKVQIIESYYHHNFNDYVPRRQLHELNQEISTITRYIDSHEEFASLSLLEVLNAGLDQIPSLGNIASREINTLEHMLFLNLEDGFKAIPLPVETQFSPAFHIGIADFDNDGNEDLFLSQNFFGLPPGVPRHDAGRGILLKGDGRGNFDVIPGHISGIKVYGEQRGAAISDINQNGKVDIVISQNNAETRLYMNENAKQGIRVRLLGPVSNRDAIGSSVRLAYADGSKGPLREIQAGSGYWSQASFTQVLGSEIPPESIEVTWPDGKVQNAVFRKGQLDMEIHYDSTTD